MPYDNAYNRNLAKKMRENIDKSIKNEKDEVLYTNTYFTPSKLDEEEFREKTKGGAFFDISNFARARDQAKTVTPEDRERFHKVMAPLEAAASAIFEPAKEAIRNVIGGKKRGRKSKMAGGVSTKERMELDLGAGKKKKEKVVKKYIKKDIEKITCGGSGFSDGTVRDSGYDKTIGAIEGKGKKGGRKLIEKTEMKASSLSGFGKIQEKLMKNKSPKIEDSQKKAVVKKSKVEDKKEKPKTEWMMLVEKVRKEHPEFKGLKPVIEYIKKNNLYVKK